MSQSWIPFGELEDLMPHKIDIGQTIKVHHCKTGNQNDRLYIKRIDKGYLYNCYHCGCKGLAKTTSGFSTHNGVPKKKWQGPPTKLFLPRDSIRSFQQWDTPAKKWIWEAGLAGVDVEQYGLVYSPKQGRVVIPVYQDGELVCHQARRIFDKDPYPKYLTKKLDIYAGAWYSVAEGNALVLVEDVLSGIKCSKFHTSIALLGTELHPRTMKKILDGKYSKIYLFLDNDNRYVKSKQRAFKDKLSMFYDVELIRTDKDPKRYPYKDLKELLRCHG